MSDAKAILSSAIQAFVMGRFDEAIARYTDLHLADPHNAAALKGLAMAHAQIDKIPEAIEWAKKLTLVAPQDAMAWATLSMLLQKAGDVPGAEAAQSQARVLGWKTQLKK